MLWWSLTIKLFSLLLYNCNFVTDMNPNVNIWHAGYRKCSMTHRQRTAGLGQYSDCTSKFIKVRHFQIGDRWPLACEWCEAKDSNVSDSLCLFCDLDWRSKSYRDELTVLTRDWMESDVAQVSYLVWKLCPLSVTLNKTNVPASKFERHRHGWITQGPLHSLTSQSQHFRERMKSLMVRLPSAEVLTPHPSFLQHLCCIDRISLDAKWTAFLQEEGGLHLSASP